VLIGQLQDEVDFLHRQGESLQRQLDVRASTSKSLVQNRDKGDFRSHEDKKMKMLLDLNLVVESPVKEVIKEEN
jgi:cell fate (sporulation/competence/biofilm development) regulator YlbF (YheA/YmcA/DUF963 family)